MYKWIADDTYLKKDKEVEKPNIYLLGEILISQEVENSLIEIIKNIKSEYTHPNMPVKWNIKDSSIQEIYKRFRLEKDFEKLKSESNIWRKRIFQESLKLDYTIFISCIENYQIERKEQKPIKENLSGYLFCNALMRVGLFSLNNEIEPVQVILDWPSDSNPKPYYDEYYYAYNAGTSADKSVKYFCGKLKDVGFEESVYFTKCTHSTLLQFVDLIVGATRDFIETHLQSRDYSIGKELTELILPKFDGYPREIHKRGLNVSSQNQDFKKKINELLKKYVA